MGCTIADFRDKEVVNICDGRRLGYVIDVEFDIQTGQILSLVLPGKGGLLVFGRCEDIYIDWCKIKKIGDDIILVDIGYELPCGNCDATRPKRKFF